MLYNNQLLRVAAVIVIAAICLINCTYTVKDIETAEYKAHPLPSDQVRIVKSEADVSNCRYVASLRAKGGISNDALINELRNEAGKLGANVLLVIEPKSRKLKTEDIAEAAAEAIVVSVLPGGGVTAPSQDLRYMDGNAYYCE